MPQGIELHARIPEHEHGECRNIQTHIHHHRARDEHQWELPRDITRQRLSAKTSLPHLTHTVLLTTNAYAQRILSLQLLAYYHIFVIKSIIP